MRTLLSSLLLLLVIWCGIVRGKFVKIENLHSKEVNEDAKNSWNAAGNQTIILRGYKYGGTAGGGVGAAKLLQSVNEVNLKDDAPLDSAAALSKTFYHPGQSHLPHHGWSNGVINNNNAGLAAHSPVQCLLFGVMGLLTFLLNSVMALLLSVKLPGGLDGLLGPLLGGLGLGALNKQDVVADTNGKHNLAYVHYAEKSQAHNNLPPPSPADNELYYEKN